LKSLDFGGRCAGKTKKNSSTTVVSFIVITIMAEDPQQPSSPFNAESYNSWRYGDEASLYSIAEDSREDRQSEALSRAGMSDHAATMSTVSGGDNRDRDRDRGGHGGRGGGALFTLSGIHPWRRSVHGDHDHDDDDDSGDSDDDDHDANPVEVKWVSDDEDMNDVGAFFLGDLSPPPPILSSGQQDFGGGDRMYRNTSAAAAAMAGGGNSRRGPGSGSKAVVSPPKAGAMLLRRTPSSSSSEDSYSQMLGYRLNPSLRRPHRLVIVTCFMCVAIAAIVLAVVLTAPDDSSNRGGGTKQSPGFSSSGGGDDDDDGDSSWDDIDPPTPSPVTSQPTGNYSEIIAEAAQEFAYESISACPYTDSSEFFDLSAPQAEVFRELIIELKQVGKVQAESSSANENDGDGDLSVDFESTHGMGYLLERWALLMLFFSTNGEYWDRNGGWYTDTDVCEWEAALRTCEPRVQGEAAMTYLDLRK
jgi:hypothetical protein